MPSHRIGIIDYGMGNLRSVQKALEHLHAPADIITHPEDLAGRHAAILPGVGAIADALSVLRERGFDNAIREFARSGRPLLGICLGLQLFFDRSFEDGEHRALGLLAGEVVRFQTEPELKIPHMGWNSLEIAQPDPLLEGISDGDHVYFVHSYHADAAHPGDVLAWCTHGTQRFPAVVRRGNVWATQFHPEKSQRVGLRMLTNFANLVGEPANC